MLSYFEFHCIFAVAVAHSHPYGSSLLHVECWRTVCVFANDDHPCGHPNKTSWPPLRVNIGSPFHRALFSMVLLHDFEQWKEKTKDHFFSHQTFDKFSIFPHWLISESDDLLFNRHGLILAGFVRILCSLEAITVAVCFFQTLHFISSLLLCLPISGVWLISLVCFVVVLLLDTGVYEIVCASTFLKEPLQNRWRTWGAEALKEPPSPHLLQIGLRVD